MSDTPQETYLGDGLYASFDGWQITLRAPRPDGDHWVALEPAVLRALIEFAGAANPFWLDMLRKALPPAR